MSDLMLVCGSREWPEDKLWFVTAVMVDLRPTGSTILTGGARGVDCHAHTEALRLRWPAEVMPADWDRNGKRAGFIRNIAMLERQPVLVLAFQWNRSKGTGHTIREAYRRGIPMRVFNEESLRPDLAALDYDYEPITPNMAVVEDGPPPLTDVEYDESDGHA